MARKSTKTVLTLNGKTYEKTKPTVNDWFLYLSMKTEMQGKNMLESKEAGDIMLQFVADYYGAPLADLNASDDAEAIVLAHQQAQKAVFAVFENASEIVWGEEKNAEGQEI